MSLNKKEAILKELADSVVNMDEDGAVQAAQDAIESELDAFTAIDQGLSKGMATAGDLFESEEYFIPELLMCSDAMYAGLEILKPHLKADAEAKGSIVIGVIEGDTHDIGKNLVRIMFETGGYEVHDLGRDVPPIEFVKKAEEVKADIIALSTLMTTTMDGMGQVVSLLNERGNRADFKVIVGGGPISSGFAKKIGADGYAANAAEALKLVAGLISKEVHAS